MEELHKLIDFWKKTPSIRALIHQGFNIPDGINIQKSIKNLPAPERRDAKRILTEILAGLENLHSSLSAEHRAITESIFKTDLVRTACLSYHNGSFQGKRR